MWVESRAVRISHVVGMAGGARRCLAPRHECLILVRAWSYGLSDAVDAGGVRSVSVPVADEDVIGGLAAAERGFGWAAFEDIADEEGATTARCEAVLAITIKFTRVDPIHSRLEPGFGHFVRVIEVEVVGVDVRR